MAFIQGSIKLVPGKSKSLIAWRRENLGTKLGFDYRHEQFRCWFIPIEFEHFELIRFKTYAHLS